MKYALLALPGRKIGPDQQPNAVVVVVVRLAFCR
jgi:hypothetical protein